MGGWSLLSRPCARCSFSQQVEQRSESEIRAATDKASSTNEICWVGELVLEVFLPETCFKDAAFYKGQKSAALVLTVLITPRDFEILFGRGLTLKQWDLG